jgi:hypothetical protein
MRPQPLVEEPCVDCRRRIRPRKQANLGAETICGGCMAALSPGWTWTVAGAISVLVCGHCAVRCSRCRPVGSRPQWGDHHHRGAHFRKLAIAGQLKSPIAGGNGQPDSQITERRRTARAAARRLQAEEARSVRRCRCGCGEKIPPEADPRKLFVDSDHRNHFHNLKRKVSASRA